MNSSQNGLIPQILSTPREDETLSPEDRTIFRLPIKESFDDFIVTEHEINESNPIPGCFNQPSDLAEIENRLKYVKI